MHTPKFEGDICSHRHAYSLDNFIRRLIQNPGRIVGPYIKKGDTVIDLGCGPGFFTIDMARMVGETGRVFAVDLQEEMLSRVAHKAVINHLSQMIHLHRCSQQAIGLPASIQADFALAYYMVHETLDPGKFLAEVRTMVTPGGRVLIVEPRFHVSGTSSKPSGKLPWQPDSSSSQAPGARAAKAFCWPARKTHCRDQT